MAGLGRAGQGMGAYGAERERFNQGSIPRHARSRLDLAWRGLARRGQARRGRAGRGGAVVLTAPPPIFRRTNASQ